MNQSDDARTVRRGVGTVAGLTLVSRILGFVRDLLVAKLFGASPVADAFFVAFRIPNLLRSFVAEGAMSSAFVPVFSSELAKDSRASSALFRSAVGLLLCTTIFLSVAVILAAPQIVALIAPGFGRDPQQFATCVALTRIMLPYIVFVSLVALMNGALNAHHRFGIAAWAQVLMNLSLIAGAAVAFTVPEGVAVQLLAWSVLFGGVVQVVAQLPSLRAVGLTLLPSRKLWTPQTREMLSLLLPALVGATVYQITIFLNTVLASLLEPGTISWLFYADRLTQLPVGVFTVALGSVLLPMLSNAAAAKDQERVVTSLTNALRYTSFVLLPCALFLLAFSQPLIELLFERGRFSALDSSRTAQIVCAIAPGLWCTSMYSIVIRAFISNKDTRTPVVIGVTSLIVSFFSALLLMGPPIESVHASLTPFVSTLQTIVASYVQLPSLGGAGLAAASSLGAACSLICAIVLLRRHVPTMRWAPIVYSTLGGLGAAAIATTAAYLVTGALLSGQPAAFVLLCGGGIFVTVFTVSAFCLRMREVTEIVTLLKSRKL